MRDFREFNIADLWEGKVSPEVREVFDRMESVLADISVPSKDEDED